MTENLPDKGGPLDGRTGTYRYEEFHGRDIDIVYTNYFSGCSVAINPVNPGGRLAETRTYPSTDTACEAIAACAAEAANGP